MSFISNARFEEYQALLSDSRMLGLRLNRMLGVSATFCTLAMWPNSDREFRAGRSLGPGRMLRTVASCNGVAPSVVSGC